MFLIGMLFVSDSRKRKAIKENDPRAVLMICNSGTVTVKCKYYK